MALEKHIIRWIEKQCGRRIYRSADCEYLALDIESLTGEHIGVNTVKRLLGFINDEHAPRITTLDIIARYLGCETWDQMQKHKLMHGGSGFTGRRKEVVVRLLEPGRRILITYFPERSVEIEYLGDFQFIVLKSENSKLIQNDRLFLTHIIEHYPLYVSEVIRDGESLGTFSTGESSIFYRLLPMSDQMDE